MSQSINGIVVPEGRFKQQELAFLRAATNMGGGNMYAGGFASPAAAGEVCGGVTNAAGHGHNVISGAQNPINTSQALVLAQQQVQHLGTNGHGHELIIIFVGVNRVPFFFHKNKLLTAAPGIGEHLGDVNNQSDRVELENEHPGMFYHFENYVYYGRYPTVEGTMNPIQRATRIVEMCQLYVFAETIYMPNEFTNKLMDNIQDGFAIANRLPEGGLIHSIYSSSPPASKLRAFCAHSLVFGLRAGVPHYDTAAGLLQQNRQILDEFLEAFKFFTPGNDPRIRDCRGEPGCTECVDGRVAAGAGYWPCAFHTHDIVRQEDNGDGDMVFHDVGCYLWGQ